VARITRADACREESHYSAKFPELLPGKKSRPTGQKGRADPELTFIAPIHGLFFFSNGCAAAFPTRESRVQRVRCDAIEAEADCPNRSFWAMCKRPAGMPVRSGPLRNDYHAAASASGGKSDCLPCQAVPRALAVITARATAAGRKR
jgi:hypothetical protein